MWLTFTAIWKLFYQLLDGCWSHNTLTCFSWWWRENLAIFQIWLLLQWEAKQQQSNYNKQKIDSQTNHSILFFYAILCAVKGIVWLLLAAAAVAVQTDLCAIYHARRSNMHKFLHTSMHTNERLYTISVHDQQSSQRRQFFSFDTDQTRTLIVLSKYHWLGNFGFDQFGHPNTPELIRIIPTKLSRSPHSPLSDPDDFSVSIGFGRNCKLYR